MSQITKYDLVLSVSLLNVGLDDIKNGHQRHTDVASSLLTSQWLKVLPFCLENADNALSSYRMLDLHQIFDLFYWFSFCVKTGVRNDRHTEVYKYFSDTDSEWLNPDQISNSAFLSYNKHPHCVQCLTHHTVRWLVRKL